MNKKGNIFLLILIVILFISMIAVYIYKISYKVNINLTDEIVKVNIYDKIDVKSYIVNAIDNKKVDLTDKIKIKISADDLDDVTDNTIFVKSYSDKVITYTVKNKGNKFSKKLTLKVISDPFDENYFPNHDYDSSEINNDDVPVDPGDTTLTKEQQDYINSFLN